MIPSYNYFGSILHCNMSINVDVTYNFAFLFIFMLETSGAYGSTVGRALYEYYKLVWFAMSTAASIDLSL